MRAESSQNGQSNLSPPEIGDCRCVFLFLFFVFCYFSVKSWVFGEEFFLVSGRHERADCQSRASGVMDRFYGQLIPGSL